MRFFRQQRGRVNNFSARFESLESRLPFAGNITADFHDGVLLLKGDDLGNGVLVKGTGVPNQVRVEGVFTNGAATLVNGLAAPVIFNGVSQSIVINTFKGDDDVVVESLRLEDDLIINTHAGNDTVTICDIGVCDNVEINTHEDDDIVTIGKYVPLIPDDDDDDEEVPPDEFRVDTEGELTPTEVPIYMANNGYVSVDGSLIVNTGSGLDEFLAGLTFVDDDFIVHLEDGNDIASIYNGTAGKLFHFTAGAGNDMINVYYLSSFGDFIVDTGSGNDLWSHAASANYKKTTIHTGSGIDYVAQVINNLWGDVHIDTGADGDTFIANNMLGKSNVTIFTGHGNDTLNILGSTAKKLHIDSGSDNDKLCLVYSAVEELFGVFGHGDDEVNLYGNLVKGKAFLDGGSKTDALDILGNLFGSFQQVGFESITYLGKCAPEENGVEPG
ncbi:MAG: hypothetical protein SFX18_00625 [Pirellulales bacterium]|nr:hypothetical protein [Pirellulales bacterium]